MNILYVALRFPYPLLKGDQLRAFHQLKHLGQRHTVDLIALSGEPIPPEGLELVKSFVRKLEIVPHGRGAQLWGLTRGLFNRLPLQTNLFYSARAKTVIRQWRTETQYDVAQVQMARLANVVGELDGIPTVLDLQDAYSLNMRKRYEADRIPMKWAAWLEWKRMARLEQDLCARCAATTVVNERDAQAIGGPRPPLPVALGVDTSLFTYGPADGRAGLIFFGNLGYFPNRDAAVHLVQDIMPLLWKDQPGLRVKIAGANPPPEIQRAAQDKPVDATGFVDQLAPHIRSATIAVFPLRSGSGTQFKILEAFSSGTPVVTSPWAAAGLTGLVHNEHALVADGPEKTAAAVRQLLHDATLRERLAKNSRKLVEDNYSWEASGRRLEEIYQSIIRMK